MEFLLDSFLQMLFHAIHFKGRNKLSVGQLRQSLIFSAHTNEALYVIVPRSNFFVTDGPVDAYTLFQVSFEIKITPSKSMSRPQERFSTHLVTLYPPKWLCLVIRMFGVFNKKMFVILSKVVNSFLNGICLQVVLRQHIAIRQLPGIKISRWI